MYLLQSIVNLYIETNKRRKRAAFIENDKILSFFEEFKFASKVIGNIYVGKIVRIDENLKAAFIDYGSSKLGLLPLKAVHPRYFQIHQKDKELILQKMKKNPHYIRNPKLLYKYDISDLLKIGQKIIVQVSKAEREKKGVSLSTYLSIFGHFLKYIPNSINNNVMAGEKFNTEQKLFLETLVDKKSISGTVSITSDAPISNDRLKSDLDYVLNQWNQIAENLQTNTGDVLYTNQNFLQKIYQSPHFSEIKTIVTEGALANKKIAEQIVKTKKVKVFNGFNIFEPYESQITAMFHNIVQFPGGYLILNQNNMGTMIDINYNKEENMKYLQININAAKEIANQIIKRNFFGLILIDFIDLDKMEDFSVVEDTLKQYLKDDKAKMHFGGVSKFYVYQLTRQYCDNNSCKNDYFEYCEHCENGFILKTAIVAENLFSKVKYFSENTEYLEIYVSMEIAEFILNNMQNDFSLLSQNTKTMMKFIIVPNKSSNYTKIYKHNGEIDWY